MLENFLDIFEVINAIKFHEKRKKEDENTGEMRKKFQAVTIHPLYDCLLTMACIINLVAIFVRDYYDTYGTSDPPAFARRWIVSEFVINFIFLGEMIFFISVWGPLVCWKTKMHIKLEAIYQIVNIVLFIRFVSGHFKVEQEFRFLEIIIMIRALKILNIMNELTQFRLITKTFEALIQPFVTLLLCQFLIFYVFAQVGDRIFGGKVYNNDIRILGQDFVPDNFVLMNMNDLTASFMTLFALMVVNNWQYTTGLYTLVMESNYYRWYSILFFFFCVVLVLNIVVAFTIDMYDNIANLQREKDKQEEEALAEKEGRKDSDDEMTDQELGSDEDPEFWFSSQDGGESEREEPKEEENKSVTLKQPDPISGMNSVLAETLLKN